MQSLFVMLKFGFRLLLSQIFLERVYPACIIVILKSLISLWRQTFERALLNLERKAKIN